MEATLELEKIRDQQKESWNKFSPGWKKWDSLTMEFLKPAGDEIIKSLDLQGDETVLDIAAGTGEPGLTIASILKSGKVISTDLSEGMMDVAKENAQKRGLKNFETKVCDVTELPFDDETFDAVSCRFGFMFFPDMQLAANEIARVLKPAGRFAISVWDAPEKNFWVTAMMGTINKFTDIPPPPPGSPGMFRCTNKEAMTELFKKAGLKNIGVKEVKGKLNAQTADTYWQLQTEVGAPIVAALSKADDATKKQIKDSVYALLKQKYPDGNVSIDSCACVYYGEK